MPDYFTPEFRKTLSEAGSIPQSGVKIGTSRVSGHLHYTAELPLEASLQVPANTTDGGHTIAERAIDTLNASVADPDKKVRPGDKVVLTIILGTGRVKYASQVYDVKEDGVNGCARLFAREYHGNWKDNNISRPQKTIGRVIDQPHGVDIMVQIGYHHRPIDIDPNETSFIGKGAKLLEEPEASETQPSVPASVEDIVLNPNPGEVRPEDKTPIEIEPDPAHNTPPRTTTRIIRNRRAGFEDAMRQSLEAEESGRTSRRWRARS